MSRGTSHSVSGVDGHAGIDDEVVLVGADGMLGRAFAETFARRGTRWRAALYPTLDLTRPSTIAAELGEHARLVVSCAAWTDVDGAETSEDAARAVNATGVALLAAHATRIGATLVDFGTDYVFGGDSRTPYPVDAPLAPLGAYGRTKAEGERLLAESGARHLHVRTSWLYAPWAKNFVRTIATMSRARPELRVVDDQRGRPTSAEHLASATLALLEGGATGTWHLTDGGQCSWFELATEIVRLTGSSCRVVPCTTAEFPRPAPRPAYSVLDLSASEALLGPMPDWRTNLARVVARLEP